MSRARFQSFSLNEMRLAASCLLMVSRRIADDPPLSPTNLGGLLRPSQWWQLSSD